MGTTMQVLPGRCCQVDTSVLLTTNYQLPMRSIPLQVTSPREAIPMSRSRQQGTTRPCRPCLDRTWQAKTNLKSHYVGHYNVPRLQRFQGSKASKVPMLQGSKVPKVQGFQRFKTTKLGALAGPTHECEGARDGGAGAGGSTPQPPTQHYNRHVCITMGTCALL